MRDVNLISGESSAVELDGSSLDSKEEVSSPTGESMRSASSLNPSSADPHSATRTDLRSIPQMPAESPGSWWSAESRQRSRELNSREVSRELNSREVSL